MVRTAAAWLGTLLVVSALGWAAVRVRALERGELEHESGPRSLHALASSKGSTRVSARLTEVELQAGEEALFELCSSDRLDPALWLGALDLVVFALPEMKLMLRVPLDAAHLATARRNADRACIQLGGGAIERSARYSLDAVWPGRTPPAALLQVPLQARVLAVRPLQPLDRASIFALGGGVLLWLLALAARPRRKLADAELDLADAEAPDTAAIERPASGGWDNAARGAIGAFILVAALVLLTRLPTAGASATLYKGLLLIALQTIGVIVLVRVLHGGPPNAQAPFTVRSALALTPPLRRGLWLLAALLVAVALVVTAKLALRLVPSTSEAPIQSFVSWPSGRLCFAALGLLLPLGEELLFRGYLYRTALRFGQLAAFAITLVLFVALHAEQSFGNWGGLLSISVAGVALTALRAQSGSVLVPALAHVLYNFTLSAASF